MSMELHAFLLASQVPDRSRWQASIDASGFPLQLDPELDISKDRGFSPCKLEGENSGFELYVDEVKELIAAYPHVADHLGDRDYVISFRWGGDMKEAACVLGAAYALVKGFGALAYYPDDDMVYSSDSLMADARECLSEAGSCD